MKSEAEQITEQMSRLWLMFYHPVVISNGTVRYSWSDPIAEACYANLEALLRLALMQPKRGAVLVIPDAEYEQMLRDPAGIAAFLARRSAANNPAEPLQPEVS